MRLRSLGSKLKHRAARLRRVSIEHEKASIVIAKHYKTVQDEIRLLDRSTETTTAVVIHLYYVESWQAISKKLASITAFPFDVFVSLPKHNLQFKSQILASFPKAFVYEAPNRGRDVLPFIAISDSLYKKGYKYVLKLHSKKSTHRTDGSEWMSDILNSLVPTQKTTQLKIINTLQDTDVAMIGPKGQYTSLKVNFEANGTHMTRILTKLRSRTYAYDVLQVHRADFGFFAGTMFWVNLESIQPLVIIAKKTRLFESEEGQIDATYAHAIERLLCVFPETERKSIYEVGLTSIEKIAYSSGDVPDWSHVYIGPKAND